jgi:hypothetical protein
MTEKKTANKPASTKKSADPTADLEKELAKHPAVESGQLKNVGNHLPDDPDAKG